MDNQFDVIVCGGGIAGISSALASARHGAKTCLIEKGYNLGGLATLGLVVIYLPLDDGSGVKMSGGICEELLVNSLKYSPRGNPKGWNCSAEISEIWKDASLSPDKRKNGPRYEIQYSPASFMISAEELLLENGVKILYDARLCSARKIGSNITAVGIDTKTGTMHLSAKAFVDATGDADLCFFAGEKTVSDNTNRRTGWYYSYNNEELMLHEQTDSIYGDIPSGSRTYSGTDIEDITQSCIDSRQMIINHVKELREKGDANAYPLMIPSYHGLRMTRRLEGSFEFSEDKHESVWFDDAVGMIGNWKKRGCRYSLPYRIIKGVKNENLYAAGRCVSADKSGWDLTRVIPTCAVTGEAAGIAAALQARSGVSPDAQKLQNELKKRGVILDKSLFDKTE